MLDPSMSGLTPGERLGDWVLGKALGQGGMGVVLQCHNAMVPDLAGAVKVVRVDGTELTRQRFNREIAALARLQHPALIRVLSGGEDVERGVMFMVMELVDGEDLDHIIRRGGLPWRVAAQLFRDLADGLDHAHARGISHRDIKPANIMLAKVGGVKLLDFGIALDQDDSRLTMAGYVPGTVQYLSPETFEGGDIDWFKVDVYALGLAFHEAITGSFAFPRQAKGQAALVQLLRSKSKITSFDPGPDHPDDVRAVVTACTELDPTKRPSMAELRDSLDAALAASQKGGFPDHESTEVRRPELNPEDTFVLDVGDPGKSGEHDAMSALAKLESMAAAVPEYDPDNEPTTFARLHDATSDPSLATSSLALAAGLPEVPAAEPVSLDKTPVAEDEGGGVPWIAVAYVLLGVGLVFFVTLVALSILLVVLALLMG